MCVCIYISVYMCMYVFSCVQTVLNFSFVMYVCSVRISILHNEKSVLFSQYLVVCMYVVHRIFLIFFSVIYVCVCVYVCYHAIVGV